MFASTAKSFPDRWESERCTAWVGSDFTHKHKTRLERLSRDKYFSLLWTLGKCRCKLFNHSLPLFPKTFFRWCQWWLDSSQGDQIEQNFVICGQNFVIWATFLRPCQIFKGRYSWRYLKSSEGKGCRCFGLSNWALLKIVWQFLVWRLFWATYSNIWAFFFLNHLVTPI